ncbi:hypothetical protein ADIS_1560 [Lunatimonas lonarensis]|uniref:Uncharacterized protein n=1 Tax=Lunatimonas lonarensis TaxID=1232681 RepID=R7ZV56_9BACT|nr:hypothetical protein [Lunatimonas lonarensis]EON78021.1 hypothetical protein ADIS_1560 [Lunatimonas lonarensis]
MKKLVFLFALSVSFSAFGQDVINMEISPKKPGSLYQEHDSFQLDDSFSDVVTITELKLADPLSMPIAVPPLGFHGNMAIKKLMVPSEPGLPAYESKSKPKKDMESLYEERTFYLILPDPNRKREDY